MEKPGLKLFAVLLLSGAPLAAQMGTATLSGIVSDPSGSAIPAAQVTLASSTEKASRQSVTVPRCGSACTRRPLVEAIASGLTEMFSGHLMRRRVSDMLARYDWISRDDLAYFTNRIEAVSGEGKSTLDIVVRHSVTAGQQDAAVAALSFKCDVLWAMLDAIERA